MGIEKKLLKVLHQQNSNNTPTAHVTPPPIWMMRQAGRYLPEYQQTRKEAGSFLQMCDAPNLATEVTCQPIRRYGFDGAIIFADILLLPRALGQKVWFEAGVGPKLTPLEHTDLKNLAIYKNFNAKTFHENLAPVYTALQKTRAALPEETTLLGFCGAPWTVLCYMLNGEGSKDWASVRAHAYKNPDEMAELLNFLAEHSADYLAEQVKSGADVVQVFDSWAGAVPPALEELLLITPLKNLMQRFKRLCPEVPLILFPKGVKPHLLEKFAKVPEVNALGLDERVDLAWAAKALTPDVVIQGNLDNALLLTTPEKIKTEVQKMLDIAAPTGRYIVNLGHGVLPPTPLENVKAFVNTVKNWHK